jgi:hypothetical protein
MLGVEVLVSHRTPSSTMFRLWPCLVCFIGPWSIGSLLVTILTSGVYFYILSSWLSLFVPRKVFYWVSLVMALWLRLVVPRRNRGSPVNVHTWLCCSARADITVSSHNPLWDYINVLSWHNLSLLREILFGASSVMVSRLRTYGAAAKLRASCECAHRTVILVGCWYQGL